MPELMSSVPQELEKRAIEFCPYLIERSIMKYAKETNEQIAARKKDEQKWLRMCCLLAKYEGLKPLKGQPEGTYVWNYGYEAYGKFDPKENHDLLDELCARHKQLEVQWLTGNPCSIWSARIRGEDGSMHGDENKAVAVVKCLLHWHGLCQKVCP